MSKVWLVTAVNDFISDYVVRVCATEEIAEEYIERFKGLHEFNEPEEWDVDAECPTKRICHTVWLTAEGTLMRSRSRICDYDSHFSFGVLCDGGAGAESTQGLEAALKLARDRLVEMKGVQASGS